MDATSLATLWATIGLLIFLAIMVYVKVPGMITKSLDERAERIGNELEEARRLREEAQQLLAEYQRKRKEAEQEAAQLVESARHEAEIIKNEARQKTQDYVERRNVMAEQKIALAEREAIKQVRSSAVDIAVEATRSLLASKVDQAASKDLFASSLQQIKTRMN